MVEIKRMVTKLYDILVIPELVVTIVMHNIYVYNIWNVLDPIKET